MYITLMPISKGSDRSADEKAHEGLWGWCGWGGSISLVDPKVSTSHDAGRLSFHSCEHGTMEKSAVTVPELSVISFAVLAVQRDSVTMYVQSGMDASSLVGGVRLVRLCQAYQDCMTKLGK